MEGEMVNDTQNGQAGQFSDSQQEAWGITGQSPGASA